MIERKIGQIDEIDLRLLTAASVQGDEFDAAVIAEATGMDLLDVEERLEVLDRVNSFVRFAGDLAGQLRDTEARDELFGCARKVVQSLADSVDDERLRRGFLSSPRVRDLM